ncbi:M56 family metallopeptidase [Christiangramia forsetii]|uniref:BlaR1-like family M56 peptidase n=2 Tax=Christiangramia forsetii TaxID=411153 RepID=A0LYK4_CHRFK|nr:M56 family metallopeptidase [Christiangramia forsetii]GGG33968.1 hypothetical protein GCM10011532_17070 [Christiangramia forsetii]CAL65449.1 BlaR1-like family M56 peptidase [Christiangramia forsetii KT0803]
MESFLIYILKASALVGIFYLSYLFLLKKETTFQLNRRYLLSGLFTAAILPAIYFTRKVYIQQDLQSYSFVANPSELSQIPIETPIDWWHIAGVIYLIITGFFILRLTLQLSAVLRILKSNKFYKKSGLKYLEIAENQLPFSFFNYIVFNPDKHSGKDLELILEHEKVHAKQLHSADILFVNFVSCILWFNPFAWLYKKSVEQNLEFIADRETVNNATQIKEYQHALVKVSIANLKPALTNHFYQSFIKKRILMLNKKSSNQSPTWKLSLVIPLILAFMLLFNVKTEAQVVSQERAQESNEATKEPEAREMAETEIEKKTETEEAPETPEEIEVEIKESPEISRSTVRTTQTHKIHLSDLGNNPLYLLNGKSIEASKLKNKYIAINSKFEILIGDKAVNRYGKDAKNGIIIIPDAKVIRNFNKEMKNIKSRDEFTGKYIMVGDNGKPNFMSLNSGKSTVRGQGAITHNSNLRVWESRTESNSDNVYVVGKRGTGSLSNKNGGLYRTENSKSIEFESSGDMPIINSDKSRVKIISQNGGEPIYIINGIAVDESFDLNTISPSDISSMIVLKGENATDKYGKKAENGAIQIFTKSYVGNEEKISKDPRFYAISSNTSDVNLKDIEMKIEKNLGIKVKFSGIERNEGGEITSISISGEKEGQNVSSTLNDSDGLRTILIGLSKDGGIVISNKASKGQF